MRTQHVVNRTTAIYNMTFTLDKHTICRSAHGKKFRKLHTNKAIRRDAKKIISECLLR